MQNLPDFPKPALQMRGISKRFGSVQANIDISIDVAPGEVLALLGENGAGKSTLVSILFGHYRADAGEIHVFGSRLPPGQPKASLQAGIGIVHQHFALADNLSVLENALVGTEPLWRLRSGLRAMRRRLLECADRFGLVVDPDALVATLSIGERQRTEILKALVRDTRILILDEPTAVLTPAESEALFTTLQRMVDAGLSIVFISHKLNEVLRVADRICVLRGGRLVATRRSASTSREELATLMIGHAPDRAACQTRRSGPVVLSLEAVCADAGKNGQGLYDLHLSVRAGEVVGIAGVSGNGQALLVDLLCGLCAPSSGKIELCGKLMDAEPRSWVDAGVARIPEDRYGTGLVGELSVWENAVSERLHQQRFSRLGFLRRRSARNAAQHLVNTYDVRCVGLDSPARAMSGGNMQKLVLGRALSVRDEKHPILIVAAQPTWGLDVGAVAAVHSRLMDAASQGSAILLISDDLDEIFTLCDRIAVMHGGRLGHARSRDDWSLETIGLAMAGVTAESSHAS